VLFFDIYLSGKGFCAAGQGSIVIYRTIVLGQAASRPSASHSGEVLKNPENGSVSLLGVQAGL
jgi:hypothetical protein